MGIIRISVTGSFGAERTKIFAADEYGHAHAVAEAIQFLADDVLPEAINNDHQCRTDGERPSKGFIK